MPEAKMKEIAHGSFTTEVLVEVESRSRTAVSFCF